MTSDTRGQQQERFFRSPFEWIRDRRRQRLARVLARNAQWAAEARWAPSVRAQLEQEAAESAAEDDSRLVGSGSGRSP